MNGDRRLPAREHLVNKRGEPFEGEWPDPNPEPPEERQTHEWAKREDFEEDDD